MKFLFLFLMSIVTINAVFAQNTDCKVLLDSLKGSYDGECLNGKASGKGKAVGINSYEGGFKNGLPEGQGKYTWSNGNYYYGSWKKGQKDGKGELHQFEEGKEMLVQGYWKKDNYRGEYEHPYVVTNVTTDVGRLQVSKLNNTQATLTLTVESLASNASLYSNSFATGTVMTAHQVTRGSYMSLTSNSLTNKQITTFRGIVFPFRCIFNFGTTIVEIEFFEKGAWDVMVPITR